MSPCSLITCCQMHCEVFRSVFFLLAGKAKLLYDAEVGLLCLHAASDSCGTALGEMTASLLKPLTASCVCVLQEVWSTACVWCVCCGSRAVVCAGRTRSPVDFLAWLLLLFPAAGQKTWCIFGTSLLRICVFSQSHVRYFAFKSIMLQKKQKKKKKGLVAIYAGYKPGIKGGDGCSPWMQNS